MERVHFAINLSEKVLICGPAGSGKGHFAKLALKEASFITYGDLLTFSSSKFYESPRQKLFRLFETALIERRPMILGHLEELIEEPGLWLALTAPCGWFDRLQTAKLSLICTINSDSKHFGSIKDHFLHIITVPRSDLNYRFADLKAAERENAAEVQKILDKMTWEGRTCAQLSNDNGSRTKLDSSKFSALNENSLTFDKVYGVSEEIKSILQEQATFSKGTNGARGVLLHGPPGTGKTRLALALAGTLGRGTTFITISTADLLCAEIGVSEIKLKETFNMARASEPAVIFFDEIDALFPKNPPFHLLSLQHQFIAEFDALERDQLLTGRHHKIFILAATNHLKKIETRILSVERIELQLEICLPDFKGRLDILLNDLLRKDDETIDWNSLNDDFIYELAKVTENKSPADLAKIVQDARKNSWRSEDKKQLSLIDFSFSFDK